MSTAKIPEITNKTYLVLPFKKLPILKKQKTKKCQRKK